jgi:hypothetical protein
VLWEFYNGGVNKDSCYTHEVASPQVEKAMVFDNVNEILDIQVVAELAIGCLHEEKLTINRYLTRSMGAMRVLLQMPAMPPEIKLFIILYLFFSY